MIWIPLVSALSGVVLGGGITLLGQFLADKRSAGAKLEAEDRSRRLAAVERKRGYIVELYGQVCRDLAWVDDEQDRSGEQVNQDRADTLDDLRMKLTARQTTAAAAMALVEDDALKDAVTGLYNVYIGYLIAEAARMDREFVEHDIKGSDVAECREQAASAVQAALEGLRVEEAQIFRGAKSAEA